MNVPIRLMTPVRADWIAGGFRLLSLRGPAFVRVEPLAADLGVEPGGFYSHFNDLRAFHLLMQYSWAEVAGQSFARTAAQRDASAEDRLLALAERASLLTEAEATGEGPALEPAMRDWARVDPAACMAVRRVDVRRLEDLTALLAGAGQTLALARQRAEAFYAALIGLESLRLTSGVAMRGPLMAAARAALHSS